MINKRKKFSRMRASHTHGGGAKKKRRGSGNRGGFGMAGTGKRADQKKPTILKLYGNKYFGKFGFVRPPKVVTKIKAINISDIEKKLDFYINKNLITKEKEFYVLDLNKLGYNKLLGTGTIINRYKVIGRVSEKAKGKIEKLGGIIEEV
ncbi:MAG: uL15 family ribosomal protein [Nanoarchaeota archaeon]|mgnify:FL=1